MTPEHPFSLQMRWTHFWFDTSPSTKHTNKQHIFGFRQFVLLDNLLSPCSSYHHQLFNAYKAWKWRNQVQTWESWQRKKVGKQWKVVLTKTRWWFQRISYVHPENWGKDPIWRAGWKHYITRRLFWWFDFIISRLFLENMFQRILGHEVFCFIWTYENLRSIYRSVSRYGDGIRGGTTEKHLSAAALRPGCLSSSILLGSATWVAMCATRSSRERRFDSLRGLFFEEKCGVLYL